MKSGDSATNAGAVIRGQATARFGWLRGGWGGPLGQRQADGRDGALPDLPSKRLVALGPIARGEGCRYPVSVGAPRQPDKTAWQSAIDYGIDVSLLEENLRLTPNERLEQLVAMQRLYDAVRGEPVDSDPSER